MSKTKKLTAAALAVLALAAVPATSVATSGSEGVRVSCQAGGGGGCQI